MRLVFLLGSGASRFAGFPMVGEITERILSGEPAVRHTDGTYRVTADPQLQELWGMNRDFLGLLRHLQERIRPFYKNYKPGRDPNYEDLAYVTRQLEDSIGREYENPALEPFIDEVAKAIGRDRGGVFSVAQEANYFIRDIVWHLLGGEPKSIDGLNCVVHAAMSTAVEFCTIATLNHDRLIDRAFTTAGLAYSEGFGRSVGDLSVWDDFSDEPDDTRTRLLRLHGCVDWFRFQLPLPDVPGKTNVIASCRDVDHDHVRNAAGELIDCPPDDRPEFLVGNFTKMLEYGRSVYADSFVRFHEALRCADCMIVIGYGFGDKGINSRVIDWVGGSSHRVLCLVHPSPDRLIEGQGRGAARRNLAWWRDHGRLRVIAKGVEEASWSEIQDALS